MSGGFAAAARKSEPRAEPSSDATQAADVGREPESIRGRRGPAVRAAASTPPADVDEPTTPFYLSGGDTPQRLAIQRQEDTSLPQVPRYQLTPPSLLEPQDPYARYRGIFVDRLRVDPALELRIAALGRTLLSPASVLSGAAAVAPVIPVPPAPRNPAAGTPQDQGGATPVPPPQPAPSSPASPSAPGPSQQAPPSADVSTLRPGGAGDVLGAVLKVPQVSTMLEDVQNQFTSGLSRYWGSASTGERIGFVSSSVVVGAGVLGPLLGFEKTRDVVLPLLNNVVLPIPKLPGYGLEFRFGEREVMVGAHVDVGRLLPALWGFGDASLRPIGGPPGQGPASVPPISRKAEGGAGASGDAGGVAAGVHLHAGRGAGLDPTVRHSIEPALGADLSSVRVHTGAEADGLARSVSALAFTSGGDIFFRSGRYAPGSTAGARLLAHELAHVAQQARDSLPRAAGGVEISQPADAAEREADVFAERAVASASESSRGAGGASRAVTPPTSGERSPQTSVSAPRATPIVFPHAARLGASLGSPILGQAVLDPEACTERGVPAFTDGPVSHFATAAPPLRVAAHEHVHQLQHARVTHDGGVGPEHHADAVARRVANGHSAGDLLTRAGAPVPPALRHYTELSAAEQTARGEWLVGNPARVGDAGRTVTTTRKRDCFADPALISSANAILSAKKSGIQLSPGGGGPAGNAPDGSGWKSLVRVKVDILSDPGDEYWADCGRASREVQGPTGTDTKPKGIFRDSAGNRQETNGAYDPQTFRDEIYVKAGLGPTPAAARAAYLALSPADKDAFDKKHGINKYAAPGIGESFVARRDDALTSQNFNWHWGAVVMAAGPDTVTFENFAKPGTNYSTKDREWYFETYGPPTKPGQTFHEQNQSSVGLPGMNTTTMAARTSPDPTDISALPTAEILKRWGASRDVGERTVLESEMGKRWLAVRIQVTKAQEGTDKVYVEVSSNGNDYETGWRRVSAGSDTTFMISLKNLTPLTGRIRVKVYEYDAFFDDLISHLVMDYPYSPTVDSRPWDDAAYVTTVRLL
jgi:hypothetical protein